MIRTFSMSVVSSKVFYVVAMLAFAVVAKGQTTFFDDDFNSGIDTNRWNVVEPEPGIDVVQTVSGKLNVISSGAGDRWANGAGVWSNPNNFPLITRPLDDTEYNVYFEGVELPSQIQRFALGFYSTNPPAHSTPKFPDDNGPNGGTSYYFMGLPNNSTPNKNWLSTFSIGAGGAAADSTGGDGFHTWEFGKVYDLRLQVTKDDVTWWGREQPFANWKMLQDPDANILGHPGTEPNGRNDFGLFVHASASGFDNGIGWQDANVKIDRIYATQYKPSAPQVLLDDDFTGGSLDTNKWDVQVPEPGQGDLVELAGGKLHVVNRNNGSAWAGGVGIYSKGNDFPLITRPTDPGEKIVVDFIGVKSPEAKQRFAFGLYGINPPGNPVPKLPDADDANGGLAYAFEILPDNDNLPADSNHVRAKVINERYAATDNFHHAWLWMYPEVRDFRIEVTADEVNWYIRKDLETGWRVVRDANEDWVPRLLTEADNGDGYWRSVYDPGILSEEPYDGTAPNDRDLMGIFVHGSSAGNETGTPYVDADFTIDRITVSRIIDISSLVLPGDANKDGQVTGADLISVQQNFGSVGPVPLQGDANNDGQVTGADLISVQQNFGNVATPAASVPEPATLAVFILVSFAFNGRLRC